MGAKYDGEEAAILDLMNLSKEAKKFLCHHLGNSLNVIITGIEVGRLDLAMEAAWHIVADLERTGIKRQIKRIDIEAELRKLSPEGVNHG